MGILSVVLILLIITYIVTKCFGNLLHSIVSFTGCTLNLPLSFFVTSGCSTRVCGSLFQRTTLGGIASTLRRSTGVSSIISSIGRDITSLPFKLSKVISLSFLSGVGGSATTRTVTTGILSPILLIIIGTTIFLLILLTITVVTFLVSHFVGELRRGSHVPLGRAGGFVNTLLNTFGNAILLTNIYTTLIFIHSFVFTSSRGRFMELISSDSIARFVGAVGPLVGLIWCKTLLNKGTLVVDGLGRGLGSLFAS